MAANKLGIANLALTKIGAKRIAVFPATLAAAESAEAREIFIVYDDIRDEVLEEHPWSFAQKRASLAKPITAATNANPVVVTCAAHGFANGDTIKITGVLGMSELNGNSYKIASVATNSFSLQNSNNVNIDGTSYGVYSSGGYARKVVTLPMDEDNVDIVYDKPSDFIHLNFVSDDNALVKVESYGILSNVEELKIIYTYQNDDPTKYSPAFVKALAARLAAEICFPIVHSTVKAAALLEDYEKIKLPRAIASDSQQSSPLQPVQNEWENARLAGSGSGISGRAGQSTWHPIS